MIVFVQVLVLEAPLRWAARQQKAQEMAVGHTQNHAAGKSYETKMFVFQFFF